MSATPPLTPCLDESRRLWQVYKTYLSAHLENIALEQESLREFKEQKSIAERKQYRFAKVSRENAKKILEQRASGTTISELSKEFKVSIMWVKAVLRSPHRWLEE